MVRWHEPNASYYSARYAERKRAAQRQLDELIAADYARNGRPCVCCGEPIPAKRMLIRCDVCRPEYERIATADGFDAAAKWESAQPYQRKLRGES